MHDNHFRVNEFVLLEVSSRFQVGLILSSIFEMEEQNFYSFLITNYYGEKIFEEEQIIDNNISLYVEKFNDLPEGVDKHLSRMLIGHEFISKEKSKFKSIGILNFSSNMTEVGGLSSDWETINAMFPFDKYIKKLETGGASKIIEIPISKFLK